MKKNGKNPEGTIINKLLNYSMIEINMMSQNTLHISHKIIQRNYNQMKYSYNNSSLLRNFDLINTVILE